MWARCLVCPYKDMWSGVGADSVVGSQFHTGLKASMTCQGAAGIAGTGDDQLAFAGVSFQGTIQG